MKKVMFAAAAMLAGAVFAEGEITSDNIVGYVTQNIDGGKYYMIGCPFEEAGTGENFSLDKFITGQSYDLEDPTLGAIIQINIDGDNKAYYYQVTDVDENENPIAWGWLDGDFNEYNGEIAPGFCCWFKNPTDCTITVSGQVADTDKDSITVPANTYKMIANPFPLDIMLNGGKIDGTGLTYSLEDPTLGAMIQIGTVTSSGIDYTAYYYQVTDVDENENPTAWGWLDADFNERTDPVKAFTGFWLKDPNGGTIKFVK